VSVRSRQLTRRGSVQCWTKRVPEQPQPPGEPISGLHQGSPELVRRSGNLLKQWSQQIQLRIGNWALHCYGLGTHGPNRLRIDGLPGRQRFHPHLPRLQLRACRQRDLNAYVHFRTSLLGLSSGIVMYLSGSLQGLWWISTTTIKTNHTSSRSAPTKASALEATSIKATTTKATSLNEPRPASQ